MELIFKLMGAGFILFGSLGFGFRYRAGLAERRRVLREMQELLEFFESEISYGKATFPEICGTLSNRMPENFKGTLETIAKKLSREEGRPFAAVFREEFAKSFQEMSVSDSDAETFLHFLSCLGSDEQLLLERMRQCRQQLHRREERMEEEYREKSRVAISLSGFLGITMILILM